MRSCLVPSEAAEACLDGSTDIDGICTKHCGGVGAGYTSSACCSLIEHTAELGVSTPIQDKQSMEEPLVTQISEKSTVTKTPTIQDKSSITDSLEPEPSPATPEESPDIGDGTCDGDSTCVAGTCVPGDGA